VPHSNRIGANNSMRCGAESSKMTALRTNFATLYSVGFHERTRRFKLAGSLALKPTQLPDDGKRHLN
jgi:hypothetical protein